MNEVLKQPIKIYLVRNKEGKFFRSKGYGGYGRTWVDDISVAKIYTKLGQARSRVTWFYSNYPEYGLPDIFVGEIKEVVVLEELDRVEKSIKNKKERKIKQQIYQNEIAIKHKKEQIVKLKNEIDQIK